MFPDGCRSQLLLVKFGKTTRLLGSKFRHCPRSRQWLVGWRFFRLLPDRAFQSLLVGRDGIPRAAWKRPLGQPLVNPGGRKTKLPDMIDDGHWQGAHVGGFGAGTFSRTYSSDFVRWPSKSGVHKYQTVFANQFAIYQKTEGSAPVAEVLASVHPQGSALQAWKWDYPVGAGDYHALYPKSCCDYRWEKFPAHVVWNSSLLILPDNYKEASYTVPLYRWHADNPTQQNVTVSLLFSWTNMIGWFRDTQRDLSGHLDHGKVNRFQTATLGHDTMKGLGFDGFARCQWARLRRPDGDSHS